MNIGCKCKKPNKEVLLDFMNYPGQIIKYTNCKDCHQAIKPMEYEDDLLQYEDGLPEGYRIIRDVIRRRNGTRVTEYERRGE